MDRYPVGKHTRTTPDVIPGWSRMVLYALAILAPFVALFFGRLEGHEAVAAVVTLFGVLGPAVAAAYNLKQKDKDGASYRAGYAEAVGQHVADGGTVTELPDDDQTRGKR